MSPVSVVCGVCASCLLLNSELTVRTCAPGVLGIEGRLGSPEGLRCAGHGAQQ